MKKIRVFLSRPNPFTEEQLYLVEQIKLFFLEKNIETITLQAKHYSTYESFTILNEMIKRCYGMIILSFGHTYIQYGVQKKGAIKKDSFFDSKEKNLKEVWITSTFCQIEGAMAISNNIPILTIKQDNLKKNGILKEDDNIFTANNFDLESKESIDLYIKNFYKDDVKLWINKINEKYRKIEDYMV